MKPRRFFQLHLSTALLLMLLAAGLLGANLTGRKVQMGAISLLVWGWPFDCNFELERDVFERGVDASRFRDAMLFERWMEEKRPLLLVGNIAVALSILTLAAVLMEWRLRRRDYYKETSHG